MEKGDKPNSKPKVDIKGKATRKRKTKEPLIKQDVKQIVKIVMPEKKKRVYRKRVIKKELARPTTIRGTTSISNLVQPIILQAEPDNLNQVITPITKPVYVKQSIPVKEAVVVPVENEMKSKSELVAETELVGKSEMVKPVIKKRQKIKIAETELVGKSELVKPVEETELVNKTELVKPITLPKKYRKIPRQPKPELVNNLEIVNKPMLNDVEFIKLEEAIPDLKINEKITVKRKPPPTPPPSPPPLEQNIQEAPVLEETKQDKYEYEKDMLKMLLNPILDKTKRQIDKEEIKDVLGDLVNRIEQREQIQDVRDIRDNIPDALVDNTQNDITIEQDEGYIGSSSFQPVGNVTGLVVNERVNTIEQQEEERKKEEKREYNRKRQQNIRQKMYEERYLMNIEDVNVNDLEEEENFRNLNLINIPQQVNIPQEQTLNRNDFFDDFANVNREINSFGDIPVNPTNLEFV